MSSLLPLHPQHANMDKDRFVDAHTKKWATNIRLGAFTSTQLKTIAAFKYEGWELVGTDGTKLPVMVSPGGDMWAVSEAGLKRSVSDPIIRWDGETDRDRKMRRALEAMKAPVKMTEGAVGLFAKRSLLTDALKALEWDFIRDPTSELIDQIEALRNELTLTDRQILVTKQVAEIANWTPKE